MSVTATAPAREFHLPHLREYDTSSPLRWIASHTMQYWWLPAILVVTSIVNNWAYGNVPLNVGRGFDVVSQPGWGWNELLLVAAIVAGSAVLQGITGLLRNLAVELLAQRVERDSREELYVNLLGKSQSFHASQRVGDVMARATNDVRSINQMFSPGVMLIVDSSLAILVPLVMILAIDIRFGLVPLLFLVLLVLTVRNYNKRLAPVSAAQRMEFGAMNSRLTDAISGIEVVKANVQERYELDKFTGRARAFRDYFVRQGDIQARYWPMMAFAVCWGLALLHGLLLWRAGFVSLGNVVSFMGLFGTFRFATFISLFSFSLVQMGIASAARILELITRVTRLDQNVDGYRETIHGLVEFRDVSFDFEEPNGAQDAGRERSGARVLDRVTFTIDPGETIAVVGQTGAGKTTLTRLVNRIFDATEGEVLVDAVNVRDWNLASLRSQVSTIEQDIFLYSMSIAENIAFGRADATDEEIRRAAREAQADEFIRSFEDGYDTMIGERGVTLSGGQRQRLAIARAFLTDPRILILDDSTSAVDSRTEDQIQEAMRRIASNRTTILITHRLSQIRRADRILLLRRGRMLDTGTHDDLMERCDAYRRIFAYV